MTCRLLLRSKRFWAGFILGLAALTTASLFFIHDKNKLTPDENGMYLQDGYWVQYSGEYDPEQVNLFARKMTQLKNTYLTPENKVYWGIVPDKSHYLPQVGWPVLDYTAMLKQAKEEMPGDATFISLEESLSLSSYYKTDPHWRQESLQPVLDTLGQAMDFSASIQDWDAHTVEDFRGNFSWFVSIQPDTENLIYLTSSYTDTSQAHHALMDDPQPVYDLSKLDGKNPYDLFVSGTTPFVTLENPEATTQRELVIFRDSFSSSLAPLLCQTYKTITLIDLRYMVPQLLEQYITFTNQDVLFLYSSSVVNQSAILR